MTAFIALAAIMALVAGALVAWPLLRTQSSRALGIALIAGLPLVAAGYYTLSSGEFWRQADSAAVPAAGAPDPGAMVAALEAKLRERPDDAAGWIMLGRSRLVLGDAGRAVAAYEQAVTLTGEKNVDALIGLGEALVAGNEAEFAGRGGALFERSLELAPDDARALWYGGIAALQRGDRALTRQRWQRLAAQDVPSDVREALDRAIAQLDVSAPAGSGVTVQPQEIP